MELGVSSTLKVCLESPGAKNKKKKKKNNTRPQPKVSKINTMDEDSVWPLSEMTLNFCDRVNRCDTLLWWLEPTRTPFWSSHYSMELKKMWEAKKKGP